MRGQGARGAGGGRWVHSQYHSGRVLYAVGGAPRSPPANSSSKPLGQGLLPPFFKQLTKLDQVVHPSAKLQINVSRIYILRMANLYAFLWGLYIRTGLGGEQQPAWSEAHRTPPEHCAGTVIGQEFYKLVLVDAIVTALSRTFWAVTPYLWVSLVRTDTLTVKLWALVSQSVPRSHPGRASPEPRSGRRAQRKRTPGEIDLVDAVLQLVYRQALIWAGFFFCPVLPLLGVLANALYFQVNRVLVGQAWLEAHKATEQPCCRSAYRRSPSRYGRSLLACCPYLSFRRCLPSIGRRRSGGTSIAMERFLPVSSPSLCS